MRKYLFFAAALFTLAACDNDDNLSTDDPTATMEIRLSSGIQVQTRATHDLDTQLAADEEVHVWVDDAVTSEELYANNTLTVGADQTTLGDGDTMYFPSTGNAVNIYAIHGNFSDDTVCDNFWGTSITHSVATDQTTTNGDYAVSDLVYCDSAGISRQEESVQLQFKHLLSKIEVVLVQGNGTPGIANVEILNTQLDAQFTPSKTDDWAVSAEGDITDGNPITIDNGTTEKTNAEDADKTNDILNEAIIVPQTLQGGTQFIRITTDKEGVLVYALDEDMAFVAGKKYRYTITANLKGLTVTASIDGWDEGTENTGDAEMEE